MLSAITHVTDIAFIRFVSEAHKYFVEHIAKAYQALTDPVARENYEKYGHPDGRQVIKLQCNKIVFLFELGKYIVGHCLVFGVGLWPNPILFLSQNSVSHCWKFSYYSYEFS